MQTIPSFKPEPVHTPGSTNRHTHYNAGAKASTGAGGQGEEGQKGEQTPISRFKCSALQQFIL